jgi:hypothetical protein
VDQTKPLELLEGPTERALAHVRDGQQFGLADVSADATLAGVQPDGEQDRDVVSDEGRRRGRLEDRPGFALD